ncbi:receptor activity-modifying protein 1-like isoform X2 [Megalops cyprinoides]|uniref:receptor activity-modifying protein 1-like isoform X2 n=1 Tax=Megalops cyprinoides TaxID=118141 RepID=UPI0018640267|nr:receptor activity-modifying protein 1-like isoform X2 [Megalops cyprinoides]
MYLPGNQKTKKCLKMRGSLSSMGFVGILFWACVLLACRGTEVQQTPTPGYNFTTNASHVPHGFSYGINAEKQACGNKSDICEDLCSLCDSSFYTRTECYETLIMIDCHEPFKKTMSNLSATDLCTWDNIMSPYDNFTVCTETKAECLWIPYPNKLVETMFVDIHAKYFKSCPTQEYGDPPPSVVFALVMTPICLIPVMVVLVVMKTKNGDRRS